MNSIGYAVTVITAAVEALLRPVRLNDNVKASWLKAISNALFSKIKTFCRLSHKRIKIDVAEKCHSVRHMAFIAYRPTR